MRFSPALILLTVTLAARTAVPPLTGPVIDMVDVITPEAEARISGKLLAFQREKGAQIAILTIASAAPESPEEFSIRAAEAYKLGRKGIDDGVLILVARDDRAVRIEVGYGLEGVLSDIISRRIIEEQMKPHFRSGNFDAGFDAGIDAMMAVIRKEPLPAPIPRSGAGDSLDNEGDFKFGGTVVALVIVGAVLRLFAGVGGAALGVLGIGAAIGGLLLPGILSGLMAALISLVILFGLRNGRSGGGFYSSGGGSFGGGGYSGGGGSFGGGGATGRW